MEKDNLWNKEIEVANVIFQRNIIGRYDLKIKTFFPDESYFELFEKMKNQIEPGRTFYRIQIFKNVCKGESHFDVYECPSNNTDDKTLMYISGEKVLFWEKEGKRVEKRVKWKMEDL